MYKAYKAEFTLGLIGAILGIVAFVIILIVGVVIGAAGVLTYAFGRWWPACTGYHRSYIGVSRFYTWLCGFIQAQQK